VYFRQALAAQSAELDDLRLQVPPPPPSSGSNTRCLIPHLLSSQLLSASSAGQRSLARVTAADALQSGEELRSQLVQLKVELNKLQQVNVDLHKELKVEQENAAKQLAGASADAEGVIQQLRRVVEELKEQLRQQVGWGI
jgi:hypothetical protein